MKQNVWFFLCVRYHFWVLLNKTGSPVSIQSNLCRGKSHIGPLLYYHWHVSWSDGRCLDLSVGLISPAGSLIQFFSPAGWLFMPRGDCKSVSRGYPLGWHRQKQARFYMPAICKKDALCCFLYSPKFQLHVGLYDICCFLFSKALWRYGAVLFLVFLNWIGWRCQEDFFSLATLIPPVETFAASVEM